ncbi:MAG: uncharacterized membrane protein (DUF106 family) [Colwellia polaris]|jgi:uncharacterized membrane protein (DUF106 family)
MIYSILTTLFGFYDAIFQPLLAQGPYISLGVIAAGLAVIFSLLYWLFLDKEKRDEIKEKLDKQQEKMKEAQKDENKDASEHMKKTFELNRKFMMVNFKPSIATMVFVALLFPWLGATYAPAVELQQTGNNTGVFEGNFTYAQQNTPVVVDNTTGNVSIRIDGEEYSEGGAFHQHGIQWRINNFKYQSGGLTSAEGYRLKVSAEYIQLPFSIPFAGTALNWLGFYIIILMPLSILFRKLLGVQ